MGRTAGTDEDPKRCKNCGRIMKSWGFKRFCSSKCEAAWREERKTGWRSDKVVG